MGSIFSLGIARIPSTNGVEVLTCSSNDKMFIGTLNVECIESVCYVEKDSNVTKVESNSINSIITELYVWMINEHELSRDPHFHHYIDIQCLCNNDIISTLFGCVSIPFHRVGQNSCVSTLADRLGISMYKIDNCMLSRIDTFIVNFKA